MADDIIRLVKASKLPDIPAEIRTLLDAGNFEAIDTDFLSRIESDPLDVPFLLGAIRGVVQRKRTEQAQMLLDLMLEALSEDGAGAGRLGAAVSVLRFWPACATARRILFDGLKESYRDSPHFDALVKHCGFERAEDPLRALETLEMWLRFDEGSIVYMQAKGVGRVKEINLSLETVRVDFMGRDGAPMSLRIAEAARMLQPLPKGHFLRDTIENTAQLQRLAETDPGELLRRLFQSVNRPLNTAELKEMLSGIVPAQAWAAWWNRARQDSRLVAAAGARTQLSWSDSAAQADAQVAEAFAKAGPRQKLEMAKKYLDRSEELGKTIVESLVEMARGAQDKEPGFALEIALTLESRIPASLRPLVRMRADDFLSREDIVSIIRSVSDRALRRKAVSCVKQKRGDWVDVYFSMLAQESDAQCLELVYDALSGAAGGRLSDMVTSVMKMPATAPGLFAWVCRELPRRTELKAFAGASLITTVVSALQDLSMKEFHSQLRKLFDPGQACRIAVGNLKIEQAREILTMFDRDVGLEPFRKDEFLRDINTTFPKLNEPEHEVFYVTAEALEAKQEEFKRIVQHELPKNREEIIKAKEFGDLSENFEYHAARARQEMLSSRAKTLGDELNFARVIDFRTVDASQVNVGTSVRLAPAEAGGDEITVTILGPWDSDPSKNIISHLAPAARTLFGAKVGDTREYHGAQYRIAEIRVWTR